MNRKDTILIAVIINAGLLAILFTTAIVYDTDKEIEQKEFLASVVVQKPTIKEASSEFIALADTGDEVDNALKYYSQPSNNFTDHLNESPVPIAVQSNAEDYEEQPLIIPPKENPYVEVVVKKGDALDKIARANGTTVSEIKRLNHLQTEKLSIGQKLKIPLKKPPTTAIAQKEQIAGKKEDDPNHAVYYVVKSGDNPWKIAKQFNVKYDDILLLNNLDEAKARNMKIGDRIRVK